VKQKRVSSDGVVEGVLHVLRQCLGNVIILRQLWMGETTGVSER
jgi:hypothetical protein